MDAQNSSDNPAGPVSGGTVEPANRAAVAKEKFQTPKPTAREHYELRDPFAEVTYRTNSFQDMVAKAEQLGSSRFTALSADGKRTPVTKSGGEWHRGQQLAALLQRPLDTQKDEPEPTKGSKRTARQAAPAPSIRGEAAPLAKLDHEAERADNTAKLEAALRERYVIKRAPMTVGPVTVVGHTEYRFRGDTSRIAFTESTFRLATDTNSPSVARSMVDVAQARSWKGLRVAGSEDFRRLVWLEASVRGVKAVGYEPNPADLDLLARERAARQTNRLEPMRESSVGAAASPVEKSSARGGGRKAVVAAIEAILVAKNVPEAKRQAVLQAADQQLALRARAGQQVPKVKVYDRAAPTQRPVTTPVRELVRSRERATPTPSR